MPETHDLPLIPVFVHTQRLAPKSKRLHLAPTNELDEPFRRSNSLVVRLRGSYGLVFGLWRRTYRTEDEALREALQGDLEDPYQLDDETLENIDLHYRPPLSEEEAEERFAKARNQVGRHANDLDDEAELLNMLGLW
jgi:hypothetical protein